MWIGPGVMQGVVAFGQRGERLACLDRHQMGHFGGPHFSLWSLMDTCTKTIIYWETIVKGFISYLFIDEDKCS